MSIEDIIEEETGNFLENLSEKIKEKIPELFVDYLEDYLGENDYDCKELAEAIISMKGSGDEKYDQFGEIFCLYLIKSFIEKGVIEFKVDHNVFTDTHKKKIDVSELDFGGEQTMRYSDAISDSITYSCSTYSNDEESVFSNISVTMSLTSKKE